MEDRYNIALSMAPVIFKEAVASQSMKLVDALQLTVEASLIFADLMIEKGEKEKEDGEQA